MEHFLGSDKAEDNSDNGGSMSEKSQSHSRDEYACIFSDTSDNVDENFLVNNNLDIQKFRVILDTPERVQTLDQVGSNGCIIRPYNQPSSGITLIYIPAERSGYCPEEILLHPGTISDLDFMEIVTPNVVAPVPVTGSFDVEKGLLPESVSIIDSDENALTGSLNCRPKTCNEEFVDIIMTDMDDEVHISCQHPNMAISSYDLIQVNSDSNLHPSIEHQIYVFGLDDQSQPPPGSDDIENNDTNIEYTLSEDILYQSIASPENIVSPSVFLARRSDDSSETTSQCDAPTVLNVDSTSHARRLASADYSSTERLRMAKRRLFHNDSN